MDIGIFAKTFAVEGALPSLAAVRAAGYDCTQFNLASLGLPAMPDRLAPGVAESIAAAARETGVTIAAISGTYNMVHPDTAVRARGLARLEVLCAHARAMATGLVTLCTGSRDAEDQWRFHPDNATPEAWQDLRAEMAKALDLAERHDVDLGIEPELANVVAGAADARRLIDEMGSARLKVILDPANLFELATAAERRGIIERAIGLVGPEIAMAHAKDRTAAGAFAGPGQGVIDFAHFAARLRAAGFDGPLVAHGLDAADAAATAVFLRDAVAQAGNDAGNDAGA